MGSPKKKPKQNFKSKDLQKSSLAFNAKLENRPFSFRGGYQGGISKPRNKGNKFAYPSNYKGGNRGRGGNKGRKNRGGYGGRGQNKPIQDQPI